MGNKKWNLEFQSYSANEKADFLFEIAGKYNKDVNKLRILEILNDFCEQVPTEERWQIVNFIAKKNAVPIPEKNLPFPIQITALQEAISSNQAYAK